MTLAGRLISAALLVSCLAGLVACGSSDHGRNATAAAAVSQTFLDVSRSTVTLTATQASCLGTGIIRAFGIDRAVRYGFLTRDLKPVRSLTLALSRPDAATYADLYLTCADPSTTIKDALVARIAAKTATAAAALRSCLDRTLTRAVIRDALRAAASGDTSQAPLAALVTACGKLG